jgi:hypothetical protein
MKATRVLGVAGTLAGMAVFAFYVFTI